MSFNQSRHGNRIAFPWIASLTVAFLGLIAVARADTKSLDALWRTYFNAATLEIEASQNAAEMQVKKDRGHNALILLESALDVANRIDPDGPRPRMTIWLEYLNYYGIGEGETAEKVMKNSKPVELKNFGADLLPVASTLERLADTYLSHADDKVYNSGNEYFGAFKGFQFEMGILQNAYGADDIRLAIPTALFGLARMRLGHYFSVLADNQSKEDGKERDENRKSAELYLQGAIQSYQRALDLWSKEREKDEILEANSQRYMVSGFVAQPTESYNHGFFSATASDVKGPKDVQNLLSNTYEELGDLYTEMKQDEKARGQYKNAETPLLAVLKTIDAQWPNHPARAREQNMIAIVYLREKRYNEAEQLFRQALQITEQTDGRSASDTKTLAGNLAYCLRLEERNSDAQSIAQAYSVKVN
jgi:tetratricopeptide (TPR) repeat protein